MPGYEQKADADAASGADEREARVAPCIRCGGERDYAVNGETQDICYDCFLVARRAERVLQRAAVAGDRLPGTIGDHLTACQVLLAAEQEKLLPDTALVATLSDAVRLAREYVASRKVSGAGMEPGVSYGYTSIPVLGFLVGRVWDDDAKNVVHALRPSSVRVCPPDEQYDNMKTWRVTVKLGPDGRITAISQEVEVRCVGRENGGDVSAYIAEGAPPPEPRAITSLKASATVDHDGACRRCGGPLNYSINAVPQPVCYACAQRIEAARLGVFVAGAELRDTLCAVIEVQGIAHDDEECPEDDTCGCENVRRVNAAIKTWDDLVGGRT